LSFGLKIEVLTPRWILIAVAFFWLGCESEEEKIQQMIIGRWTLEEAQRNDRVTESLASLYFIFREEGTMETNLLGSDEMYFYTVSPLEIVQKGPQIEPIKYQIQQISDSTVALSTSLRNFNFVFKLRKEGFNGE
jgi:hypothetical protein